MATKKIRFSEPTYHAFFIAPALTLSVAIVLLPALLTFGASLTNWDGISAPTFVGGRNFVDLAGDPLFWSSLKNNVIWLTIFLTIPVSLALLASSAMRSSRKSSTAFQIIFLLPYVLSPVANALVWQNIIFSPVSGVVGYLSRNFIQMQNPLADVNSALYAVAAVDIWHFWGYLTLVFFAAMRQTPDDQLEAALLEGANGWQVFRFVVFPHILPTISLMLVMVTIFSFLTFDYVYLMTKGGPAGSTEMLSTLAYRFAFSSFQVGKAAAVALVMSFFGLIASIVYVWMRRNEG